MVDWFVVLTPLVLLPILWLLGFVGCSIDTQGTAPGGPTEKATKSFPVKLTWVGLEPSTTSIGFECWVSEVPASGSSVHGAALGAAAWLGAYLQGPGGTSATVSVDLPLAKSYTVKVDCTVTVHPPSGGPHEHDLKLEKTFAASQSWEFYLNNDPSNPNYSTEHGWYLA